MARLIVQGLEEEHLEERVRWFNSPSVFSQMTLQPPHSLARTRHWFSKIIMDGSRRDWAFLLEESHGQCATLIAMGGLTSIDYLHMNAELYIVVDPERTGRGIGKAAVKWMCDYGFVSLALQKIYLHVLSSNHSARRVYEKVGFVQEGLLRKHVYHNGAFCDRFLYGLLKCEWEKMPWRTTKGDLMLVDLARVEGKEQG